MTGFGPKYRALEARLQDCLQRERGWQLRAEAAEAANGMEESAFLRLKVAQLERTVERLREGDK